MFANIQKYVNKLRIFRLNAHAGTIIYENSTQAARIGRTTRFTCRKEPLELNKETLYSRCSTGLLDSNLEPIKSDLALRLKSKSRPSDSDS